MKNAVKIYGGDTMTCIYLIPQNCTFKNGEDGTFCYTYFTAVKKKKIERKNNLKEGWCPATPSNDTTSMGEC